MSYLRHAAEVASFVITVVNDLSMWTKKPHTKDGLHSREPNMYDHQLRRIDLNLLLVFQSITRHRKFSSAARELGITDSAVSHSVKRMRDIFQDELFVRHQQGIRLTPRAHALVPRMAHIIQIASESLTLDNVF